MRLREHPTAFFVKSVTDQRPLAEKTIWGKARTVRSNQVRLSPLELPVEGALVSYQNQNHIAAASTTGSAQPCTLLHVMSARFYGCFRAVT
ncbi:hypothetical protein RRG08_053974 [Elysia crispata]|uniref:Uncharacterized protein n=1 Tax=Elysia crispata TaxID=231223 RepID=A0AAE0ZFJ0_9GAST|nr:hypothetical protein RRG08_053974 [Elysia crispata]